jgi:hypothetical protein
VVELLIGLRRENFMQLADPAVADRLEPGINDWPVI